MLLPLPEYIAEAKANVRCVSAETALSELTINNGVLIDVREPSETIQSVSSSLKIPRGVLEMKLPSVVPDPSTPVYIHCATGGRAVLSVQALTLLGYEQVSAITESAETVMDIF